MELGIGHDAEGDAGRQEGSERQVELRQCMLAVAGANRRPPELREEHDHLGLIRFLGLNELLELGEHLPHAVADSWWSESRS